MGVDIKVVATATGVLSEESLLVCFLNSLIELESLIPEFTSAINIGGLCSHGEANDQGALDELVWVVTENFSIFACSWFGLIGIDNKI